MGSKRNRNRGKTTSTLQTTPPGKTFGNQQGASGIAIRQQSVYYSGNVPPPEIMASWTNLLPDAPERFMKMAEKEQDRVIEESRRNHDRADSQVSNMHEEDMAEIKGASHGRMFFFGICLCFVGLIGLAIIKERQFGEIIWIIVALAIVAGVLVAPQTVQHIAAIFGKEKKGE